MAQLIGWNVAVAGGDAVTAVKSTLLHLPKGFMAPRNHIGRPAVMLSKGVVGQFEIDGLFFRCYSFSKLGRCAGKAKSIRKPILFDSLLSVRKIGPFLPEWVAPCYPAESAG